MRHDDGLHILHGAEGAASEANDDNATVSHATILAFDAQCVGPDIPRVRRSTGPAQKYGDIETTRLVMYEMFAHTPIRTVLAFLPLLNDAPRVGAVPLRTCGVPDIP